MIKSIVIGVMVLIAIILIAAMDRGPSDDDKPDDGPQEIDSDDME